MARTNSATSFALPLRESLCTLEVSFFSLLGFSEVAIVIARSGRNSSEDDVSLRAWLVSRDGRSTGAGRSSNEEFGKVVYSLVLGCQGAAGQGTLQFKARHALIGALNA